jgi:hypothetical protein
MLVCEYWYLIDKEDLAKVTCEFGILSSLYNAQLVDPQIETIINSYSLAHYLKQVAADANFL